MPALTITSSTAASVVFGCTAETGIIINSYTRTSTREKTEVTNSDGDVVAVAYSKPMASISIEGFLNGTTGVNAAAPGVALSIANATSGSGITGGSVIVDSVTRTSSSAEFSTLSIEATQYPLL
jgi:hypothetical protein